MGCEAKRETPCALRYAIWGKQGEP